MSGCAQQQVSWVKSGATPADFERDKNQCIYEARLATAGYSQGQNARGVVAAAAQGISEGMIMGAREAELARLCMRARGYSPETAAQPYFGAAPPYSTGASAVMCKLGDSYTYILATDCTARGGAPD
jgi:hypothetical protein